MKELKIAYTVFFLASLICFLVSGFLCYRTICFIRGAVQTDGTVIDFDYKSTSSGTYYAPIVKFLTRDEKKITWHSGRWDNRAGFKTGEKIKILYNPTDHQDARIVTFFRLWGGTFILFCVGLGTGLLGAGFAFMASKFRGK